MPTPSPAERFAAKLQQDGDCWRWVGAVTSTTGYGAFYCSERRGPVTSHRWSYEYHIGAVPKGLDLDHLCRNRWCANPWHLDPVPRGINVRRGNAGLRERQRTHCPRGHEYTPSNTKPQRDGKGRRCRACHNVSAKQRRDRQRAEAAA